VGLGCHHSLHDVAAQIEFESKVFKRITILYFQALDSRRFQRGFQRINLHRPTMKNQAPQSYEYAILAIRLTPSSRGLHSCTFRINVSALCGIGGAFRGCLRGCLVGVRGYEGVSRVSFEPETAQVGLKSGRV